MSILIKSILFNLSRLTPALFKSDFIEVKLDLQIIIFGFHGQRSLRLKLLRIYVVKHVLISFLKLILDLQILFSFFSLNLIIKLFHITRTLVEERVFSNFFFFFLAVLSTPILIGASIIVQSSCCCIRQLIPQLRVVTLKLRGRGLRIKS